MTTVNILDDDAIPYQLTLSNPETPAMVEEGDTLVVTITKSGGQAIVRATVSVEYVLCHSVAPRALFVVTGCLRVEPPSSSSPS